VNEVANLQAFFLRFLFSVRGGEKNLERQINGAVTFAL
jgi:hypothetical protein